MLLPGGGNAAYCLQNVIYVTYEALFATHDLSIPFLYDPSLAVLICTVLFFIVPSVPPAILPTGVQYNPGSLFKDFHTMYESAGMTGR